MIPFCCSTGTSSHVTKILLELLLCALTFCGAPSGSTIGNEKLVNLGDDSSLNYVKFVAFYNRWPVFGFSLKVKHMYRYNCILYCTTDSDRQVQKGAFWSEDGLIILVYPTAKAVKLFTCSLLMLSSVKTEFSLKKKLESKLLIANIHVNNLLLS